MHHKNNPSDTTTTLDKYTVYMCIYAHIQCVYLMLLLYLKDCFCPGTQNIQNTNPEIQNTSSGTQIQVQTLKRYVQTQQYKFRHQNTSSDTKNTTIDTKNTSSDTNI